MQNVLSIQFTILPKDGFQETDLLFYLSLNKKRKLFNTKLSIPVSCWDRVKGKVKRGRKYDYINSYINDTSIRVLVAFKECVLKGKGSLNHLLPYLNTISDHSLPLKEILKLYTKTLTNLKSINKCKYLSNKIAAFAAFKGLKDFKLISLDKVFAEELHIFMIKEQKLSPNTVAALFTTLQTSFNHAVSVRLIQRNPIKGFKVKKKQPIRAGLSLEDVKMLYSKKLHNKELLLAKYLFLFQCLTGITYHELTLLTEENIVKASDGKLWLRVKRASKCSMIPLINRSKQLINKARDMNVLYDVSTSNKLFPFYRIDLYNRYLHKLSKKVALEHDCTTFTARVTFVRAIALAQGVSIESVSNMLGHCNVYYTKRISQYNDFKVNKEMENAFKFFEYEA